MRFRLSDQDIGLVHRLVTSLDQKLRRIPNFLRSLPYFGRQRHTAEEMGANALGQIAAAARA
jgi:hypothetical protein